MKISKIEIVDFLKNYHKNETVNITPANRGEWSRAYFYQINNKNLVIRLSELEENFINDKYAEKFNSKYLPIPEVLDIGKWENVYYAISTKLEGEYIEKLSKSNLQKTLPSILNMLDSLRKADTDSSIGYGWWDREGDGKYTSWKNFLLDINNPNQNPVLKGWKKKLSSNQKLYKKFNDLLSKMKTYIEYCPEKRELIHSDLLHYNLLIDKEKISAVLDWGCAKYGDFLYDIAWFIFWQKWHKNMEELDLKNILLNHLKQKETDLTNSEKRLKAYYLHITLDSIIYSVLTDRWKMADKVARYCVEEFLN